MSRSYTPALRKRLGLSDEQLPDGATDDQINAALRSAPTGQRPKVANDRGTHNRRPQEILTHEEREGILMTAVEAGKFSADRAKHWRQELVRNPNGTAQVIAMLQPDPLRAAAPMPGRPQASEAEEAYPAHWLGPDHRVTAQVVNPPSAQGDGVQASAAEDNGSGYTSVPPVQEGEAYPASWIGGVPEVQTGPIGFEDASMRGLNGAGVQTDVQNEQRRRTKAQS